MRERDRPLALATSSPQVRRVLSLTGADELLDVHWSRDEAVDRLAGLLGRPSR
jgi:beta-phosphoglucomutase-like phosphatase (HAD superfamily)